MTSAINGICNWSRCIVLAVLPGAIFIYSSGASPAAESSSEQFAIHGQATYVEQETSSLRAPYSGPNSLAPNKGPETTDATLYAGPRAWPGAELLSTSEVVQGVVLY